MLTLLTMMASIGHAADDDDALYRVCVESMDTRSAPRWSLQASFPYVNVEWETVYEATVRPLPVSMPSWMWERPIQPAATLPDRFTLVTTGTVAPGAVVYIDVDAVVGTSDRIAVPSTGVRPHILRAHGDSYELELCPELRQALASR